MAQAAAAAPSLAAIMAAEPGALIEKVAKDNNATPRDVVEALPAAMRRLAPGSAFVEVMKDIGSWGNLTVIIHSDDGVFEIDSSFGNACLRRADAGIGALHIGFRLQHRGAREIELGPRQLFIAGERLRALQLPSRIVENRLPLGALGAGLRKPGLGFDQLGLKRRGIQSRQDLPIFHGVIEIDLDGRDRPGDL